MTPLERIHQKCEKAKESIELEPYRIKPWESCKGDGAYYHEFVRNRYDHPTLNVNYRIWS